MHISLVAAFSADYVLGNKGKIPWNLKEDLDNFKNLTIGSAVIMGRKTYESIGHPLSNRLNVVMTRKPKGLRGIVEVKTKQKAIEVASNFSENIYVIGGEDIYMEFIKLASTMYLTNINIEVEEKPTGEISAGAGVGTSGGKVAFGVKENNFLGRGIEFSTNLELTEESIRGKFGVSNPNFRGSDRSLFTTIESSEIDRLTNYGYKTTKTGFTLGSGFEYFEDVTLAPSITTYYESLKTDKTASANLKKQKGTYFDTDFNYLIDFDKRNQKYQPTDGFRSRFHQSIPIVSDTYGLVNGYEFNFYQEIVNDIIASFGYYGKAVNSVTGEDVRISERLILPPKRLRGFQFGKIGPKDGDDYICLLYTSDAADE